MFPTYNIFFLFLFHRFQFIHISEYEQQVTYGQG